MARTRKKLHPPVSHSPVKSFNEVPSHWNQANLWIYVGLLAATFVVYGQVWSHEFLNYDDPDYLITNTHVQGGLSVASFVWAFTATHASYWIPMTWLSYMLDCQLFGLRSGPHHLMSVAIHGISTLLLYAFLFKATGARWRSAFVALVFALHPLHIEAVAWTAERKEGVSALFWMVTFLAYLNYARQKSLARYVLVVAMVACALLAKPMAVTLPVVLLLLDWWPLRRFDHERPVGLVMEKAALIPLAIGSTIVTYLVQERTGAVSSVDQIPVLDRVANAFASYFTYLVKFVWPSNLAVFYPYPESPQWMLTAAGVVTMVGVTIIAMRQSRSRPYITVGWIWFLVTLLPVIGLIQAGAQSHADRYMYLPMIGLTIAIGWGLADWFERRGWSQTTRAAGAAAICAVWAIVTFINLDYWRNSTTLFRHAIAVTDGNYVAYNNLGNAMWAQGQVADAVFNFRNAVALHPQDADMQDNLGESLTASGRPDEAQTHLERALELRPEFAKAQVDLALALVRQGKVDEATVHYRTALRIQPDNAEAHYGIGGILAHEGLMGEATPHFQEALPYLLGKLKANPDSVDDHYNLGTVYAMMGRIDEAIAQFSEAIRLGPSDVEARMNLGTALVSRDRMKEAVDQFAAAVKLRPDYPKAHLGLGRALASLGRSEEAAHEFSEALRLDPGLIEAKQNLDSLQSALRRR